MKQLTLEQAAHNYNPNGSLAEIGTSVRANYEERKDAFTAGAEWQKEQYKKLIQLAGEAANTCANEGDFATSTALNDEIERLQD